MVHDAGTLARALHLIDMTFSALTTDIDYLRDREGQFLKGYSDAALATLHIGSVKSDIELHLCEALKLEQGSDEATEALDEIADGKTARLQKALTILQLSMIFGHHQYGPAAELNYSKHQTYQKEYREIRASFPGLTTRRSGVKRGKIRTRRM